MLVGHLKDAVVHAIAPNDRLNVLAIGKQSRAKKNEQLLDLSMKNY